MQACLDKSRSFGGEGLGVFLQCNRRALISWWQCHTLLNFEFTQLPNQMS